VFGPIGCGGAGAVPPRGIFFAVYTVFLEIGGKRKFSEKDLRGAWTDHTKTLGYGGDECSFCLMSRARTKEPGFVPGPDAK